MEDSDLKKNEIDEIVLVDGSTRGPKTEIQPLTFREKTFLDVFVLTKINHSFHMSH